MRRLATVFLASSALVAAGNGGEGKVGPAQGRASNVTLFTAAKELPGIAEKPIYELHGEVAGHRVLLRFLPSGRIYLLQVDLGDDQWIPALAFEYVKIYPLAAGQDPAQVAAKLRMPKAHTGPITPLARVLIQLKGTLKGTGNQMDQTQEMDVSFWAVLVEPPLKV